MDYLQLCISRRNKVKMLKSPGRIDFALVTILNASEYSNGARDPLMLR